MEAMKTIRLARGALRVRSGSAAFALRNAPGEVDIEHALPVRQVELGERRALRRARRWPPGCRRVRAPRARPQPWRPCPSSRVTSATMALARSQVRRDLLQGRGAASHQRHRRTRRRERDGDGGADAGAAAGDQRMPVCERLGPSHALRCRSRRAPPAGRAGRGPPGTASARSRPCSPRAAAACSVQ